MAGCGLRAKLAAMFASFLPLLAGCMLLAGLPAVAGNWAFAQGPHPTQTGQIIDITEDEQLRARFVYGEGQLKPYLHVFEGAVQLTKGDSGGTFQHHRGIFIGWDQIVSGGFTSDLWHLDDQSTMRVAAIEKVWSDASSVTLIARIEWHGNAASGKPLLIEETRTLSVSRPDGNRTRVDAFFQLRAARALTLDGDRQHAGIHFRAEEEVNTRLAETSYLADPQGGDGISGPDLKWCRLLFPRGSGWFSALQLRAPGTPSLEISMRNYGRFGFFFEKSLVEGQVLSLHYRFVTRANEAPAAPPVPSAAQLADWRADAEAEEAAFAAEQAGDRDGDGQTLAEDSAAGTNPFDPASSFHIRRIDASGVPWIEFDHLPAKTYRVWISPNLTTWNPVTSPVFTFPVAGTARWTDPEGPVPPRFYKVGVE